jgi:hypothetical protein
MILEDKLKYNAITQPISKGLLAIKPQIKDPSIALYVGICDHILS